MKKIIKMLLKVAEMGIVGGTFYGAYKMYDDLTTKLNLAEDLIFGQSGYITFIRTNMLEGTLGYTKDDLGEIAKSYDEYWYDRNVTPAMEEWNKRNM